MEISYLRTPIKSKVEPPIDGNIQYLPIEQLDWEDFEKLCLALIETTYGIANCEIYGIKGQKQEGIDIFAKEGNGKYVNFQCKRYKNYSANRIVEVISKFQGGEWFSKCDRFVLCTSCALNSKKLQDKFNELKEELKNEDISLEKWDKVQLMRLLKSSPRIVYDFFGKEWAIKFNGAEALPELYEINNSVISLGRIEEGFRLVSLGLESADHTIPGVGFLERVESKDLINWINSPLRPREDPLAVLEGGAGLGKTAILKDVLLDLRSASIPVLALKADRLFASSYNELQEQISVLCSIDKLSDSLKIISSNFETPVVILIDQLDALSQSLSTNRKLLSSYRELIQDVIFIPGVRVIISCRSFDLETDPLLQTYKGKRCFKVKELDEQTVHKALSATAFSAHTISPQLLSLLKTPLHLRIFCQLNSDSDIDNISTLQELFQMLYEQKVLFAHDLNKGSNCRSIGTKQLIELLEEVAKTMYNKQQLTVPAANFQTRYFSELQYALSQNLLNKTGNNKQLQFFHQSFFDFLFARQFVESGENLITMLKLNHQGLFIRSAVRQILLYLRDYNETEYLDITKLLLRNSKEYRFHIQLLVCQQLGQIATPNKAEKLFVEKEVLKSAIHRDPFLESIKSLEWWEWLYRQTSVLELFQRTEISKSEENFIWNLSLHATDVALKILEEIDLENSIITRVFFMLQLMSKTEDLRYEVLVNNLRNKMVENSPSYYFNILRNRAELSPEWTADQLFNTLKDSKKHIHLNRNSHDEWELKEAIEKLVNRHAAVGYKLIKNLINYWVEQTRFDSILKEEDFGSEIYIDDAEFNQHDISEGSSYEFSHEIYDIFINFLKEKAKKDASEISLLIGDWNNSNLKTKLKTCCIVYLANPTAFIEEIFILLTRPGLLKEASTGTYLNYYLRDLISASYIHLDNTQKSAVHNCIKETLAVSSWYNSTYERKAEDPKKFLRTYHGELTYSFLASIPEAELSDNNLRRLSQELIRRYGTIKNEISRRLRWRSGDPSPITNSKAAYLKSRDWIKAFRKYRSAANERPFDDYEAGLARSFNEQVKLNPNSFILVIQYLLEDTNLDLPPIYLERGLEGFSESGEGFDKVFYENCLLAGIKKGIINFKDSTGLRLLRLCITDGTCNAEVVELIAESLKAHLRDEKSVTGDSVDELTDGINTVGGMAANALTLCYKMDEQTSLILESLERVAREGTGAVRAAAIYRLAYLLNLSSTSTPVIDLFIKLVGTNYRLIKAAEWSLNFFIQHDFVRLIPLFKSAVNEAFSQKTISKTLTQAWFWKIKPSYQILEFYWLNGPKSRAASLKFVIASYPELLNDQKKKVQRMFNSLMSYDDEELRSAFSFCFYKLKLEDFTEWLPLLKKYVQMPVSKGREGSFYDYLQLCVQEYPESCIELASYFDSHERPDTRINDIEKKPLELLLSAYQILSETDPDSQLLEVAMDTFDRMLKSASYRIGATGKLELVDRF